MKPLVVALAALAAQAAPVPQTASAPQTVAPQPASPQPAPCADPAACRYVEALVLKSPTTGQVLRQPIGKTVPWLPAGNIMLFPGEAVIVRLQPQGNRLAPVLVRGGSEAESEVLKPDELRFHFYQDKDGALLLQVDSRYPQPLDYAALVVNVVRGPHKTSVCTLLPGKDEPKFNLERWPEPIGQIALSGFHVAQQIGRCA